MKCSPPYETLDFYSRSALLQKMRASSPTLAGSALYRALALVAILASIVDGRLGSPSDWRLPADLINAGRRVLVDQLPRCSDPDFPLYETTQVLSCSLRSPRRVGSLTTIEIFF